MKKRKWTTQKCWACCKAGGGCSWTALGEDGKVRFEPVPDWDAERVPWRRYAKSPDDFTYKIYACPEFEPLPTIQKPPLKATEVAALCEACSVYTRALCRKGQAECRAVAGRDRS